MKLLVFGHRLEIGGTQTNAIELAAELRDRHGFDIVFHAAPGPMLSLIETRGLRFDPAPDVRFHPAPERVRALRTLVRRFRPDLIHAWDWWQGLEAYAGVHLPWGMPLLVSDMMMSFTRVLPHAIPTTFGTEATLASAVGAGFRHASLLLPPVDVVHNSPGSVDGADFRRTFDIGPDEILAVSVSRLSHIMKSEPIEHTIGAVASVAASRPLTFVIVGDGEAREKLSRLAETTNRALGRRAIVLAGAMIDPRPAYAAADVVLGMGGSALRGLAFRKPLIVLGEKGYARLFTPDAVGAFAGAGFYGSGGTDPDALVRTLAQLSDSPPLRALLGAFGRSFVVDHHGIAAVGRRLAAECRAACLVRPGRTQQIADAARTTAIYLRELRFSIASRDATPGETAPRASRIISRLRNEGSRP